MASMMWQQQRVQKAPGRSSSRVTCGNTLAVMTMRHLMAGTDFGPYLS